MSTRSTCELLFTRKRIHMYECKKEWHTINFSIDVFYASFIKQTKGRSSSLQMTKLQAIVAIVIFFKHEKFAELKLEKRAMSFSIIIIKNSLLNNSQINNSYWANNSRVRHYFNLNKILIIKLFVITRV